MKRTLCSLILLSAFILLSAVWATGASAYADTPVITQRLEAEFLNPYVYNTYSGDVNDLIRGAMRYRIKCDPQTDELKYTMDTFTAPATNIDVANLKNFPEEGITRYKYADVAFTTNCDVTFYATLNKGDETNEYIDELDLQIKKIDNKAPRIYSLVLKENLIAAGLKYDVTVTDQYSDVQLTARSGIHEIYVYHYNPSVEIDLKGTTEEIIESLKNAFTEVVKRISDNTSVAITETVQFTANTNGWYLLHMSDWLGNKTYVPLFKYTQQPNFTVYLDYDFGYEAYSMDTLVSECQTLLAEKEGKINADIYNNLKNTLQNFIVACQINETQENVRTAYFALKTAKTAFSQAIIPNPVPTFVNTELLDGELRVINLGSVTPLLPGDKLELGGIITAYAGADIGKIPFPEVLDYCDFKNPDKIINITAMLTKNDILCQPRVPMVYQIEFPEDAQIVLVSTTDNRKTYNVKELSRDGDTVQFTSGAHSEEFFFIIKYSDSKMSKGLMIGLIAGGSALVAIAIVLLVLAKMGIIRIGKASAKARTENGTERKDDLLADDTLEKYRGKDIE